MTDFGEPILTRVKSIPLPPELEWEPSQQLLDELRELEQRLNKKNFQIVAAVANLDDQERRIAIKKINNSLRGD